MRDAAPTPTVAPRRLRPSKKLIQAILVALGGETNDEGVRRVLRVLGEERTWALVRAAQETEAAGGMGRDDGQGKRTLGGVFFRLVRHAVDRRDWWFVVASSRPAVAAQPTAPEDVARALAVVMAGQGGEIVTANMVVTGHPVGPIEQVPPARPVVVAFRLDAGQPPPDLPSVLPPAQRGTKYLILASMKHWRRVDQALKDNPEDTLIVDGYATLDEGNPGAITVRARSLSTVAIDVARRREREAKKAAEAGESKG